MIRHVITALFFLLLIAGWEFAIRNGWVNSFLIPKPTDVLRYFLDLRRDDHGMILRPFGWQGALTDGTLIDAMGVTLRRSWRPGYLIGLAIGVPTGLCCGRFEFVRDTIGQCFPSSLQTLPSICWAPLSLVWFGQREEAILFIVVMGTVWSIIVATQDGVRGIPPLYQRAAATAWGPPGSISGRVSCCRPRSRRLSAA